MWLLSIVLTFAFATSPSLPLMKKLALNEQIDSEAAVPGALKRHSVALTPILLPPGATHEVWTKTGEDAFSGEIVRNRLALSMVEPLWEHAAVVPAGAKVQVEAKGALYQCRIPVIAKGSNVYVWKGRVLLKFVPQIRTSTGTRTPSGSTIATNLETQFSEVEATNLMLWIDSAGNVYR